jgi:hypothetical protein
VPLNTVAFDCERHKKAQRVPFFPQNEMQGAFSRGATSITSRIVWIGEQATDRVVSQGSQETCRVTE